MEELHEAIVNGNSKALHDLITKYRYINPNQLKLINQDTFCLAFRSGIEVFKVLVNNIGLPKWKYMEKLILWDNDGCINTQYIDIFTDVYDPRFIIESIYKSESIIKRRMASYLTFKWIQSFYGDDQVACGDYTINSLFYLGRTHEIYQFVDRGFKPDQYTLTIACSSGCCSSDVYSVLKAGAKPDQYTLTVACSNSNERIFDLIVGAGAKPNEDTLAWAEYTNNQKIIDTVKKLLV